MDSLSEIIHHQHTVETTTSNNSSRNTSPGDPGAGGGGLSKMGPSTTNSGRNTRHATVVMVSRLIDSNDDNENNDGGNDDDFRFGGNLPQKLNTHHHHHHQQQLQHDDGSPTDLVLSQLAINTNHGANYTNSIITNATRSRIITHGHSNFGLELIKQERQSHQLGSEVSGGCGSDDELDQDDCDDFTHHQPLVEMAHNTRGHHGQNHHHSSHNQHGQTSSGMHHSDSISTRAKLQQETLSVIVQPQDDSHEDDSSSQLLSPAGKMTPSSAEMIDTSDFRALHEPTYQTLTSVNDRMSPPGFSPNSSYATLTPLQPLPPISTMSDKFSYGHSSNAGSSFSVMQGNNMGISLGMGVNSPYNYDKLPSMGISPPHNYSSPPHIGGSGLMSQQRSSLSPQSSYSQNGLHSPQKSMSPSGYDSPYGDHRDILSSVGGSSGGRQTLQSQSPTLSPQSVSLHSPGGSGGANSIVTSFGSATLINGLSTIQQTSNAPNSMCSPLPHSTPPGLVQITHMRLRTPSPTVLTIQHTAGTNMIKQHHQNMISKSNNTGLLNTTSLAGQQNNTSQAPPQNGK